MKMYWKDTENILADLSQFSSLYVQYHSCVWSYIYEGDSGQENDNGGEENDYWYIGSVPTMGANVAFSLYGSLTGEKFKGCNAKTFINSFYTNTGFSDFTQAMQYAGMSVSSSEYSQCQKGMGIGCDYDNGFALHTYNSSECNPKYFSGVSNTMYSFNEALNEVQCTQIYDGSYSGGDDDDQYKQSVYGTPLQLLKYSSACNYMNYWSPDGKCPDPYGKIATYVKNYNQGIMVSHPDPYKDYNAKMKFARAYTLIGAICFILAGFAVGAFVNFPDKTRKKISNFQGRMRTLASAQKKKRMKRRRAKKETRAKIEPRGVKGAKKDPRGVKSTEATASVLRKEEDELQDVIIKKKGIKGLFSKKGKSTIDVDKFENETPPAFDAAVRMARTASHSSTEDV
jgi:hypothetical protein